MVSFVGNTLIGNGDNAPDINETAMIDAAADAALMEEEEREANDEGYCFHCGEELEDCTGYKCWIR